MAHTPSAEPTPSPQHLPSTRKAAAHRRITIWNGIGFGVGDIFGGGAGALTGTYLTLFLTTYGGLQIAEATSVQGVSTVISAVTAIVIGALSDRFLRYKAGRRFGRRRFFLLLGAPLLLLGIAMWLPGLNYWVYFFSFLAWIITLQIIMIPYATLPSEMATDFTGRTILSTTRMFFSGLSGALVPAVGGALLALLGQNGSTYTIIGVGFVIVFMICVLVTYRFTWERVPSEEELAAATAPPAAGGGLRAALHSTGEIIVAYASTLRVRAFQRHLAIYLLGVSFADVFANVFVFFVIFAWNRDAAFASLLLSFAILTVPLTPVQGWLFARLGTRGLYTITFGGCNATLIGMFALARGVQSMDAGVWVPLAIVVFCLWLFFKSLVFFTPWQVFPFIPDVDEMITRRRREGIFASMMRFLRTMTQGISITLVGIYLSANGFDATRESQTPEALNALVSVEIWWVVGGFVLAWIIAAGFALNKKNHTILITEMERLRAGGSKNEVNPATRKVVESLTGVKYDKCWPALDLASPAARGEQTAS